MPRPAAPAAALALALAVVLAGSIAAAAAMSGWSVLALLAVSIGLELWILRSGPGARRAVDELDGSGAVRTALRVLPVILLAARTSVPAVVVGTVVTSLLLVGLTGCHRAAVALLRWLRRPPVLTRNVDLGDLRVPSAPHLILCSPILDAGPAALVALGLALGDGRVGWAAAGLAAATVAASVGPLWLAGHALALRRVGGRHGLGAAMLEAVGRLRPDVVLYFASTPEEVYQVDMWLAPVERLGRPALVVVRDPEVMARLAPTSLPVACIRHNGNLAAVPLADPTAVLVATHSGNNLAIIRRPQTRTAFVGHGDSDKPDSANRFARVYDEVWVAGPLGRRRYAAAGVGIAAESIVEIGRPQVDVALGPPPTVVTVMYAPTWEGWGDDPHHSSLPWLGPALVQALLAQPGVRVLYRPHPLTGRRDEALRRAHAAVVDLLLDAGAPRGAAAGAPAAATAAADPGSARDLLDRALSTSRQPFSRQQHEVDQAAADAAFWAAAPPDQHRIIDGRGPGLMSCFGQTSALVGDVSSVVNEFLALDRPYGVTDSRGLGATAFCERFPTARGGVIIDPDLDGLDALLEATAGGTDPTAARRRQVRDDALGDPLTSQHRFAVAVDRLVTDRREGQGMLAR